MEGIDLSFPSYAQHERMAAMRRLPRTGTVVRGFVARVKSGVNGLRKQTRGARPLIHT